ncbi:unnamed protein product [Linum tenue]|uniref:RING-type domain-containing protein n=1 Tax=Linum tenue TaxID=586396 RepID=A0AAV0L8Q2_9ROSI|nr:unnamed protein product [Linum tenue]
MIEKRKHFTDIPLEDSDDEWCALLMLLANLLAYLLVLGFVIVVIFLVLKISAYFIDLPSGEGEDDDEATETDPLLLQHKTASLFAYGTYVAPAPAGASCSRSNEVDDDGSQNDVRLCVICYDEEQNSFFVPCGHSATCLVCARRIYNEENKVCPVCRRVIGRVRKL